MWSGPVNNGVGAPAKSERGFALLLVIWVVSLLTVLATMLLSDTRNEALLVRNNLETARASALAEAGVTLAIAGLLDPNPSTRWSADGTPHRIAYDGGTVTVTMADENGKIDLNLAPLELLGSLFATQGLDSDLRGKLLAEIDRRRKAAAQLTPLNFSRALIPLGGLSPRSAFYSVEDLRSIPDLNRAAFERLRPFLTVYSQSGHINPLTAPRQVLLAIPGINPLEVDALIAARKDFGTNLNPGSLPPLTGGQQYLGFVGSGGAAAVTSEGVTAGGASFTREAIVSLTDAPLQPYRILEWRQPISGDYASAVVQQR